MLERVCCISCNLLLFADSTDRFTRASPHCHFTCNFQLAGSLYQFIIMAVSMEGTSATPARPLTLKATEDKFGGIIIDSSSLPGLSLFRQSLQHSLMQWKAQVLL